MGKSFLLLLVVLCFSPWSNKSEHHFKIDRCSRFLIKGSTNVNKFNCVLDPKDLSSDTFTIWITEESENIHLEKAILQIPVRHFDCGIFAMNKDLQALLQSDQYPYIEVVVTGFCSRKAKDGLLTSIEADVEITIAQVKKAYSLEGAVFKAGNDFSYTGQLHLLLSDFNIQSPSKFLGLVQVSDEIQIEVNLFITELI